MAILDLVKGLEVLILANGKPLQEYDDDEKPTSTDRSAAVQYRASRTVTKYIESQDGEYEVHIRLDPSFNFNFPTLWATFKIDGNKSIDYVWQQYRHNGSSLWITRGAYVSKPGAAAADLVKPFTFSKIEITDDDVGVNDRKNLDGVGIITVELFRASGTLPTVYETPRANGTSYSPLKVDEKALKGCTKSHSTSFGAAIALNVKCVSSQKLDGDDKPLAVFSFKYRDRKALQSLLIIPRSPSPEACAGAADPESDDESFDLANLDSKQKRKLKQFYRELQDSGSASKVSGTIKRERDDSMSGNNTRKKRKSGGEIQMIDLTASDDER